MMILPIPFTGSATVEPIPAAILVMLESETLATSVMFDAATYRSADPLATGLAALLSIASELPSNPEADDRVDLLMASVRSPGAKKPLRRK